MMDVTRTSVRFDQIVGTISNNDQVDIGFFEHFRINIICDRKQIILTQGAPRPVLINSLTRRNKPYQKCLMKITIVFWSRKSSPNGTRKPFSAITIHVAASASCLGVGSACSSNVGGEKDWAVDGRVTSHLSGELTVKPKPRPSMVVRERKWVGAVAAGGEEYDT